MPPQSFLLFKILLKGIIQITKSCCYAENPLPNIYVMLEGVLNNSTTQAGTYAWLD
jgi:hypothetical protein